MRRAGYIFAALLAIGGVVRADQGWSDNQDGMNFTAYDVDSFSANNLTSGGATYSTPGTGTIVNSAPTWWSQSVWFVDPANSSGLASDANTGLTNVTPLLTFAELGRRLAGGFINQNVSITLMSDTPNTDPFILRGITSNRGPTITVTGVTTAVATGRTMSAARNPGPSDNDHFEITDGTATFTPWLQTNILHKTNGTQAWFWPYADLGSGHLQVSVPVDSTGSTVVTLSGGDTYDVLSLPAFPDVFVQDASPLLFVRLDLVKIIGDSIAGGREITFTGGAPIEIRRSLLASTTPTVAGSFPAYIALTNVCLPASAGGLSIEGYWRQLAGLYAGNGTTTQVNVQFSNAEIGGSAAATMTLGGAELSIRHFSEQQKIQAMGYDWTGTSALIMVDLSSVAQISSIGGQRNTAALVSSDRGSYAANIGGPGAWNSAITTNTTPYLADGTAFSGAATPTVINTSLSSIYPFPSKVFETSGPTLLSWGAISSGQCVALSGTTLQGTACSAASPFYQTWTDGAFTPLPQETFSTAGAGLSIADDPADHATVVSLPTTGTSGSCTNCSLSFDIFGRETARASGTAPVTTVTASAPLASSGGATPNITYAPIAANTLVANPTNASAAPTTMSLGTTSGVMEYVNGSPDTIAIDAASSGQIQYGSGTNGQITGSANLKWDNATPALNWGGAGSFADVDVKHDQNNGTIAYFASNSNNGAGAYTTLRIGNVDNDPTTDFVGFTLLGTGWAPGAGGLNPQEALLESSPSIAAEFLINNRGTGSTCIGTTASRTERLCATTAGHITIGDLSAGGMVKAAITSGQLGIGVAGTDYQAPIAGNTCGANTFATSISSAGTLTCTQPAFSNVSGTVACGQISIGAGLACAGGTYDESIPTTATTTFGGTTKTITTIGIDNYGRITNGTAISALTCAAGASVSELTETSGPTCLTIGAIPDDAPYVDLLTRPAGSSAIVGVSRAALFGGPQTASVTANYVAYAPSVTGYGAYAIPYSTARTTADIQNAQMEVPVGFAVKKQRVMAWVTSNSLSSGGGGSPVTSCQSTQNGTGTGVFAGGGGGIPNTSTGLFDSGVQTVSSSADTDTWGLVCGGTSPTGGTINMTLTVIVYQ